MLDKPEGRMAQLSLTHREEHTMERIHYSRMWRTIAPDLSSYGDALNSLWETLTPEQQAEWLAEREDQ